MLGRYPLGVMQGRLLPKYKGRYQAHPKGYWRDEFPIVARLGLDVIEFILDFEDSEENPLLADGGVEAILTVVGETGVGVRSICADYFMEAPLHAEDSAVAVASARALDRLLENGAVLGVTDIVVPCVDQSSLRDGPARDRLAAALDRAAPRAEALGINLSLETDLAPEPFARFLERFDSPRVTVNYDIGNSAALGFDPSEEFAAYGPRITDVHIKDRTLGGGPVVLGTGDADIPRAFRLMERYGFEGPVILQAYRDDEGLGVFKQQRDWLGRTLTSGAA